MSGPVLMVVLVLLAGVAYFLENHDFGGGYAAC